MPFVQRSADTTSQPPPSPGHTGDWDSTYDAVYAREMAQGAGPVVARRKALQAADSLHGDLGSAPLSEIVMEPDVEVSPKRRVSRQELQQAGLPAETVPGPRTLDGRPVRPPVDFTDAEAAAGYAERTRNRAGRGDQQYLPSQRDRDMLARGMAPVLRPDGSVGYAPGGMARPSAGGFSERGGVGRAGHRPDLEAKGWRLVEEEGPTGVVYVYRPQPPERNDQIARESEAPVARLPEARRGGQDVYARGEIVQSELDAARGSEVPSRAQGRVPMTRTGNTFVDSENAYNDRMIRRLAEAAGVPVAQARGMSPRDLQDMAADRKAGQRGFAREANTYAAQIGGGFVTTPSMQAGAALAKMSPEQQQQQTSFWASGGRGPTPNDIQQQRAISERLTPEQRILAEQQRVEAKRAEQEAINKAWNDTVAFVNDNYAADGLVVTAFDEEEQRATFNWIRVMFPFVSEETARAWVAAIAKRKGPKRAGGAPQPGPQNNWATPPAPGVPL